MKTIISLIGILAFTLNSLSQKELSSFYSNRIEDNKTSYIGIKWTNGIPQISQEAKHKFDGWSFYRITGSELKSLYAGGHIAQIYMPVQEPRILNDTVRKIVGVDRIQMGEEPIPFPFEGENVVYGFIDTGIDYNHADFMNADSTTRVLRYWDQSLANDPSTPTKYGYGQTCDSASINAGTCTLMDYETHGTTVAGSGSSNGLANGRNKGMAPKSEIIMVRTDFSQQNWTLTVADAIDYIFSVADSLGKPCVINTSVGDYLGSHDGTDPAGHIVDSLIHQHSGRIVVASAGNSGNIGNYHLKHESNSSDTSMFWIDVKQTNSAFGIPAAFFDLWADTADFSGIQFSISAEKVIGGFERRQETVYLNSSSLTPAVHYDTLYSISGDTIAKIELYNEVINGVYHLQLYIPAPDSADYYFGFNFTGQGKFDVWSGSAFGLSNFIETGLPTPADYPGIENYVYPDSLSTIVSSWTCLESVITVANLVGRNSYIDYDGNLEVLGGTPGDLSIASSRGPSRNGLIKPEIAAPGDVSLSAVALNWRANLISGGETNKLGEGGWHVRNGGTSMASPVLGGVAALYLERCSNGTWQDFKSKMITSANNDAFTGATPNIEWGYGKLDGFGLISLAGPNLQILGDTGICDGVPALMSLNQFYDSIYWSTGETSLSILVSTEQSIFAYAEDYFGCWDQTQTIFVMEGTTPIIPTINEVGGGMISSAGDFYQWYFEGNLLDGETSQFIFPTQNGEYTVLVLDSAGCSAESDPYPFGSASLDEYSEFPFLVFPNPSNDVLNIQGIEMNTVELFSADGKLVYKSNPEVEEWSIDLSSFDAGVYVLILNEQYSWRVIKN